MREYNKLVRDKIPDIIDNNGKDEVSITRVLSDDEYKIELMKKLEEEFKELKEALFIGNKESITEESADLIEVIRALNNDDLSIVLNKCYDKRDKRGGFNNKIFLERVINKKNNFLEEILTSDDVVEVINDNLDYLFNLIPELKNMVCFEHKHPHHHLDVWEHTLYALSMSTNDFEIRLALLFHDIGKPFSYVDDEVRHFPNHPKVSRKITEKILERLNYNKDFIDEVCYLVEYHDTPITLEEVINNKELMYKRFLVQYCDAYAHHPEKLTKRIKYLNKTRIYFKEN